MPNEDQKEYWNDKAGEQWVAEQAMLDSMLSGVTSLLMAKVGAEPGDRVLDIGCGTGETSILAAESGAAVTGVDISEPMLAHARKRMGDRGQFMLADATEYRGEEKFDLIMSRFGVMFFDDPVAAFANIRANLVPGGRIVFACWRAPQENQWVFVPMMAVRPFMPEQPEQDPHAPGPFALADRDRLADIMSEAGFREIHIEPHDLEIELAASGGVDKAMEFVTKIGPAATVLAELDDAAKAEARAALQHALAPHERDGRMALGGGIWLVEARAL